MNAWMEEAGVKKGGSAFFEGRREGETGYQDVLGIQGDFS